MLCNIFVRGWNKFFGVYSDLNLMNIKMALKYRSHILDLDHFKLSLGIFFFLSCLIESIFHQLSGSTFIFVKNTDQKAANLMFCLISPVAKTPAWFPEGQSMKNLNVKLNLTKLNWAEPAPKSVQSIGCNVRLNNFMAAADSAVVLLELDVQWD